jgi:hypothetical protein
MDEPQPRTAQVRFSIGRMMLATLFVAVDIALLRALWEFYPANVVLLVTLPTINLLAFSLLKPVRKPDARPAWIGFQVVGWAMVVVFGAFTFFALETFLAPVIWVERQVGSGPWSLASIVLIIGGTVVGYSIPQVGAALAVGGFLKRYRVVIERRRPLTVRSEASVYTEAVHQ